MNDERQFLLQHAAHDYNDLVKRWRTVAKKASLTLEAFATSEEFTVYGLRSQSQSHAGFYLSAGVHGDEPAATLGLVAWAEANLDFLAANAVSISPCLNPWGLTHNRRHNAEDVDLNRRFGDHTNPLIAAWTEFVGPAQFQLGLCLHEDYDAQGCYVYELSPPGPSLGEPCLNAVEPIIPRDTNSHIEGRAAQGALIRHDPQQIANLTRELQEGEGGLPEAIQLCLETTANSLTFETPSEYSLYDRVRAQVRFIETAILEISKR